MHHPISVGSPVNDLWICHSSRQRPFDAKPLWASCPEMWDASCEFARRELEKSRPKTWWFLLLQLHVESNNFIYGTTNTLIGDMRVSHRFPARQSLPPLPAPLERTDVHMCVCVCSFWSALHVKFVKFIKIPLPMPTSDWQQRQRCWCRKVPRAEPTSGNRTTHKTRDASSSSNTNSNNSSNLYDNKSKSNSYKFVCFCCCFFWMVVLRKKHLKQTQLCPVQCTQPTTNNRHSASNYGGVFCLLWPPGRPFFSVSACTSRGSTRLGNLWIKCNVCLPECDCD